MTDIKIAAWQHRPDLEALTYQDWEAQKRVPYSQNLNLKAWQRARRIKRALKITGWVVLAAWLFATIILF